jgi:predicted PurR-regulated permease PerM
VGSRSPEAPRISLPWTAADFASIRREVPLASPDRFYPRVFGLAAAAALGYFLLRILDPFLAPGLWAVLLAFMLFPVNLWLRRKIRGRKGPAAVLLTLLVLLALVLPAVFVAYAFFDQAVDLGHALTQTAARHRISGVEDLMRIPIVGKAISWAHESLGLDPLKLQTWLVDALRDVVTWVLSRGRMAIAGAFGVVASIALMLFLLFFFFRDGDDSAARLIGLIPLDDRRKARLTKRISDVARAVFAGTVVTSLVQGVLVAVGFWIVGLPSPVVFGTLTAVASFVPVIGTGLVLAPAVIYLATLGTWWKTIFLLVWGVAVAGSADNILRPLLISGRAEIGTLAAFVGAVGGLTAFGLVGLFLGPVVVSLAIALVEFAEEWSAETSRRPPPASP